MLVKQISIFLENKRGRLADITSLFAEHNIDICAISVADTTNFGIIRMIVNSPENAYNIAHNAGYALNTTDVIAVEVTDSPGGLSKVLIALDKEGISVEYLYSFIRTTKDSALILFKVDEIYNAINVLKKYNIRVLSQEEINCL